MGDFDRRSAGVRAAREAAAVQLSLPGLAEPSPGGWYVGLTRAEPPTDRRRPTTFQVDIGGEPFQFLWFQKCRVCSALTDERLANGEAVYHRVNAMYMAMAAAARIHRDVLPLMEGWPPDAVISAGSVEDHTKSHFPWELHQRVMLARQSAAQYGGAVESASAVGLAYAVSKLGLKAALDAMVAGEIRPRSARDIRVFTEMGLTIERDFGGAQGQDRLIHLMASMDQAVRDALPEEQREKVYARFRELMPGKGEEGLERVRASSPPADAEPAGHSPQGNSPGLPPTTPVWMASDPRHRTPLAAPPQATPGPPESLYEPGDPPPIDNDPTRGDDEWDDWTHRGNE